MGINFPTSPANGAVLVVPAPYGTGPLFSFSSSAWRKTAGTALRTNKVVNPAMQISQERGDTALVCLAGYQYYAADQWMAEFSGGITAQVNTGRLQGVTPKGSKYRAWMNVTTAQATMGTGQYVMWRHFIEGSRLVDLAWGTVNGKYSVLQFGFRGPAGTYAAAIRGASPARSFIIPFTVSAADAGWDQYYSYVIPPCLDSTWKTDNTLGVEINFTIASHGNNFGVPGSWQAGGGIASNTITQNLNTVGNQFHVFDVGLHADPLMTGVAPEFEIPKYEDDLQDCLRYWYPAYRFDGVVNSGTQAYAWCAHYVPMRINPAFAVVGTLRGYDVSVAPNITAIANYNITTEMGSLLFTSGTTMTLGRPYKTLVDAQLTTGYIAVSARF